MIRPIHPARYRAMTRHYERLLQEWHRERSSWDDRRHRVENSAALLVDLRRFQSQLEAFGE